MSPDEVKNTLAARRPDGRDDADPVIAAALAAANRDPALAARAERERASDAALAAALRDVAPPPGLREAILAGRAPTAAPAPAPAAPVAWWRSARGLALAAGLALVAGLGVWQTLPRSAPDLATLAAAARVEYMTPEHEPLVLGGSGRLRELLANPARPLTAGLDLDLAQLRADGCRRLQIAGIEVFEICFMRGPTDEYHLYIARRDSLAPAGAAGPADRLGRRPRHRHVDRREPRLCPPDRGRSRQAPRRALIRLHPLRFRRRKKTGNKSGGGRVPRPS